MQLGLCFLFFFFCFLSSHNNCNKLTFVFSTASSYSAVGSSGTWFWGYLVQIPVSKQNAFLRFRQCKWMQHNHFCHLLQVLGEQCYVFAGGRPKHSIVLWTSHNDYMFFLLEEEVWVSARIPSTRRSGQPLHNIIYKIWSERLIHSFCPFLTL